MIYLYLAGVVVAFVIIVSLSEHKWDRESSWYNKNNIILMNILKTIELLFLSSIWPAIVILLLLSELAQRISKLNIRFDFKNEEPYDD